MAAELKLCSYETMLSLTLCYNTAEENTVGLIRVTVSLRATITAKKKYQADFLVDTGAVDCVAPAKKLRAIGIKPVGKTTYESADGTPREFEFGTTIIEFMGDITAGRVIFGPDDVEPILGVTALESTGVTVNPKTLTLKRLPAIPLKLSKGLRKVAGGW